MKHEDHTNEEWQIILANAAADPPPLPRALVFVKHRATSGTVLAMLDQGMKKSEIARVLGVTPSAISKMLMRGGIKTT